MPYHSNRIPRICQQCGLSFSVPASKLKQAPALYCSQACDRAHRREAAPWIDRYWDKIEKQPDGCWLWTAAVAAGGYGQFMVAPGHKWLAHRLMYTLTYGVIPDGLYVCHRCDVRLCCNPAHLFLGTARDNSQDALNKNRLRMPGLVGTQLNAAKLTEAVIPQIRQAAANGEAYSVIAQRYGVTAQTIKRVVKRIQWHHVP